MAAGRAVSCLLLTCTWSLFLLSSGQTTGIGFTEDSGGSGEGVEGSGEASTQGTSETTEVFTTGVTTASDLITTAWDTNTTLSSSTATTQPPVDITNGSQPQTTGAATTEQPLEATTGVELQTTNDIVTTALSSTQSDVTTYTPLRTITEIFTTGVTTESDYKTTAWNPWEATSATVNPSTATQPPPDTTTGSQPQTTNAATTELFPGTTAGAQLPTTDGMVTTALSSGPADVTTSTTQHTTTVSTTTSAPPQVESPLYPYLEPIYRQVTYDENVFIYQRYQNWWGQRDYEYWWHRWNYGQFAIQVDVTAFCKGYSKMFISPMGYVAFEDPVYISPWDFGSDYPWYYSNPNAVIVPFLSYQGVCRGSKIHYSHYTLDTAVDDSLDPITREIINRTTEDVRELEENSDFQATDVHVVTWEGMVIQPHYYNWYLWYYYGLEDYCDATKHGNTFQLVLIADDTKTYAMMNYAPGQIRAPYERWFSFYYYNHKFGYQFGNRIFQISYLSGTSGMREIGNRMGNTNKAGRWIFRLFDLTSSGQSVCKAAEDKCRKWFKTTPKVPKQQLNKVKLPSCPCNSGHAMVDNRFRLEKEYRYYWEYYKDSQVCFVSTRKFYVDLFINKLRGRYERHVIRQRCCYKITWFRRMCISWVGCIRWFNGPLITKHQGNWLPGHLLYAKANPSDEVGRQYCCEYSNRFCHRFYERRPTDSCRRYNPPKVSITWGDPHITTLDGLTFTFNGHGEYWLVKTEDPEANFQLQARTDRALDKDDQETDATVFTAFAAKEAETSVVQVQMTKNRDGLELLVNGTAESAFMQDEDAISKEFPGDVEVRKNGTSTLLVTFPSEWSFVVSVGARMLTVQVTAPPQAANYTTLGLLGIFNNDMTDDLTNSTGHKLSVNATEEEIFFNFGNTWSTTAEESLFTNDADKTHDNYIDATFVPTFNPCNTTELQEEAELACGEGGASALCIKDYCVTRDQSVADETSNQEEQYQEEKANRDNNNPNITVAPDVWHVTEGQLFTANVTATDADDDSTVLQMTGNSTGGATFDNETGEFSWTPSGIDPVDTGFVARDDKGGASPNVQPQIVACSGCSGNGECDFGDFVTDGIVASFAVAKCNCKKGYEGTRCETDYNGCAEDPCKDLGVDVECVDLKPEEEEASNGTARHRCVCPHGYLEEENECVDIDECSNSTLHNCGQECVNDKGSYHCDCSPGYEMQDGSCRDVNECDKNTHDCEQICNNNEGSFQCSCYESFILSPDNKTCKIQDGAACDRPEDCSHICAKKATLDQCYCPAGYTMAADGKTCTDIDECSGSHSCSHKCVNEPGTYRCECPAGYKLDAEGYTCTACEAGLYWGVNCSQLCSCGEHVRECDPVSGCATCQPGWTGDNCVLDVDECALDASVCDGGAGLRCVNTIGSYTCICRDGYISNADGRCLKDPSPDPDDILSTVAPPPTQAVIDYVQMILKLHREYRSEYSQATHPDTMILTSKLLYMFAQVYKNTKHYTGAAIKGYRNGSLVVTYDLQFNSTLTPLEKSKAAATLIQEASKNNGSIPAGSDTFVIISTKAVIEGSEVDIKDACSILEEGDYCNSGVCQLEGEEPFCRCHDDYTGDYCNELKAAPPVDKTWVIVVAVVCSIVALAVIVAVVYVCRRRRHSKEIKATNKQHVSNTDIALIGVVPDPQHVWYSRSELLDREATENIADTPNVGNSRDEQEVVYSVPNKQSAPKADTERLKQEAVDTDSEQDKRDEYNARGTRLEEKDFDIIPSSQHIWTTRNEKRVDEVVYAVPNKERVPKTCKKELARTALDAAGDEHDNRTDEKTADTEPETQRVWSTSKERLERLEEEYMQAYKHLIYTPTLQAGSTPGLKGLHNNYNSNWKRL